MNEIVLEAGPQNDMVMTTIINIGIGLIMVPCSCGRLRTESASVALLEIIPPQKGPAAVFASPYKHDDGSLTPGSHMSTSHGSGHVECMAQCPCHSPGKDEI